MDSILAFNYDGKVFVIQSGQAQFWKSVASKHNLLCAICLPMSSNDIYKPENY